MRASGVAWGVAAGAAQAASQAGMRVKSARLDALRDGMDAFRGSRIEKARFQGHGATGTRGA